VRGPARPVVRVKRYPVASTFRGALLLSTLPPPTAHFANLSTPCSNRLPTMPGRPRAAQCIIFPNGLTRPGTNPPIAASPWEERLHLRRIHTNLHKAFSSRFLNIPVAYSVCTGAYSRSMCRGSD